MKTFKELTDGTVFRVVNESPERGDPIFVKTGQGQAMHLAGGPEIGHIGDMIDVREDEQVEVVEIITTAHREAKPAPDVPKSTRE